MEWLHGLVTIDHPDAHTRRRGRLLAIILIGNSFLLVLLAMIMLLSPNWLRQISAIGGSMLVNILVLWILRRGWVSVASWLYLGLAAATSIAIVFSIQSSTPFVTLFFLVVVVVTAGVTMPPRHMWVVLAICLSGCVFCIVAFPGALQDRGMIIMAVCAIAVLISSALIAYLGADTLQKAVDASDANALAAEQARHVAEEQAADLAAQAQALRQTEQQLQQLVGTLETPAVELADGVLLAPLVGALDTRRIQMLTQRLLQTVAAQRVRLLVLDVAGVAVIDTAVAQALINIVQAVRLLGCQVVITGVAPTVAMTLTSLGVDLSGIKIARSPQQVLIDHLHTN